jgi:hypothetical protein
MAVSEGKVKALSYIERIWWETGSLPTEEKISDVIGVAPSTVQTYLRDENFREALLRRGVQLIESEDEEILSLDQLTVAAMLVNTHDKRSMREKLEELQVETATLNSWLRDPRFTAHIRKRVEAKFADADTTAYLSLLKNMEAGSMDAIRMFMEMRGLYTPKMKMEIDVNTVLVSVVEIIQTHVKDPAILQAIATDIERIPGVTQERNAIEVPVRELPTVLERKPEPISEPMVDPSLEL